MQKRTVRRTKLSHMRNSSLYMNRALDRRARAYAKLCGVSFSEATAQLWAHQLNLLKHKPPHPCLVVLVKRR